MRTFGLETKVALPTGVGTEIGVRADVFLQHGWLLAADAALLADVTTTPPTPHVRVLLVGFESARENPHPLGLLTSASASAYHNASGSTRQRFFRLSISFRIRRRQRRRRRCNRRFLLLLYINY